MKFYVLQSAILIFPRIKSDLAFPAPPFRVIGSLSQSSNRHQRNAICKRRAANLKLMARRVTPPRVGLRFDGDVGVRLRDDGAIRLRERHTEGKPD